MYFRHAAYLFLSVLILACNPDKQTKVDQDEITFATDQSSTLFFKNVRQAYYEIEEMEAAKLRVFRHKQRDQSDDSPILNLAIVDNWRYDEAYILLEPNGILHDQPELNIKWELNEAFGEMSYAKGNKSEQVAFADQLYDRLQQGCSFSIKIDGKWNSFLDTDKSREAFRVTMFDYYRLVKRI